MKIYSVEFLLEKILKIENESLKELFLKKDEWYKCFTIPKKDGVREICALSSEASGLQVKRLQKKLLQKFFQKIPLAVCAKGFVRTENYQTFLAPHVGNHFFMRLDICNFFSSFSAELIQSGLKEFVTDKEAIDIIYGLCTYKDMLPQGAVTSPALSNILFRRIDQRILKYCQKILEGQRKYEERNSQELKTICYTRYADDMLFSSNFFDFSKEIYFMKMIGKILKDNNFTLNWKKTVISENQIVLNGYVVGNTVWLSRKKLRDLKTILYFFKNKGEKDYKVDENKLKTMDASLKAINCMQKADFGNMQELIYYLAGCRSWLIAIFRVQTENSKRKKQLGKIQKRTEILLKQLSEKEGKIAE